MSMNHVSLHARVFEGVRTARIRAFDEMQYPADQYTAGCLYHEAPASVLWVHADTGHVSPLCPEHLDKSLDQYDGEDNTFPPALIPLRNRRRA